MKLTEMKNGREGRRTSMAISEFFLLLFFRSVLQFLRQRKLENLKWKKALISRKLNLDFFFFPFK